MSSLRPCPPRYLSRTRNRRRAGAVLVAAIVVLLVVLLLSAALARALTVQHRQTRLELDRQQAAWLVESAMQRAMVQLRASPEYRGETWHVAVDGDGHQISGIAEIRVETTDGEGLQRTVEIEGRWPDQPLDRILEQRQFSITLPSRGAMP